MRFFGPIWGLMGVLSLLGFAIYRLTPRALDAVSSDLTLVQWIVLVAFAVFMVVSEGYRGFQKKFAPRTAARIRYLRDQPDLLRTLLAPLFCMGYFHATKKVQITSICLTLALVMLIVLLSIFCPEPWRGIIDVGVVLGLTWGVGSTLAFTFKALTEREFPYSAETP